MWYFLILILAASALDSFSSAASQSSRHKRNDEGEPWKNPNLPMTIEPTFYQLHIGPHFLSRATLFQGNVSIDANVLNQTKIIIVHKKKLEITDRRVYYTNGTEIPVKETSYFDWPDNDYYVMKTDIFLPAKVKLRFHFKGSMTVGSNSYASNSSLYNIPYDKEAGVESWLVVNDFRLENARTVFPCFDEPRFKTPFKITIRHYPSYTAVSNMPVEKYEYHDGTVHNTVFKVSPPMCTFQVGIAITDFPFKNKTVDGRLYRVFAQPSNLDKVDYALDVTPTILNHLQQELGLSYPIEKLDQIAVPGGLLDDSRNSWGLVTHRESDFFDGMPGGGAFAKYETLKLIALSLSRGYFGNLVTCRYWEHLWLHGGLSILYEIGAVNAIESNSLHKSVVFGKLIESAMFADSKNVAWPMVRPRDPSKATIPIYGERLFLRAAAILRMVGRFIGADTFKSCIKEYLKKYANGTAVTDDLWDVIKQQSGSDIKGIMKNWVEQTGLPVIKVELQSDNRISATQKQFLDDTLTNETYKWYVPLSYKAKGGSENLVWMNETDVTFDIAGRSSGDYIEVNIDRTGYYRVNYDDTLWGLLANQLVEDHTVFTDLSRSKLLSDASALAQAGQLSYDAFLNLTQYASKENDLTVWFKIYDGFYGLNRISRTAIIDNFELYITNLTSGLMEKLQVKDEGSIIEKQLRSRIISLSCYAGHAGCIQNATRVFKAWIQDMANVVPEEYRREVYCTGIANSVDESEWTTTLERYRRSASEIERTKLLKGLSCTRNVTLLERLLNYTLNNTDFNIYRAFTTVLYVTNNPWSDNCAWKWLKNSYELIDSVKGANYTGKLLPHAVQHFNTEEQFQEVREFYTVYPKVSKYNKDLAEAFIRSNIRWLGRNLETVKNWLSKHVQS